MLRSLRIDRYRGIKHLEIETLSRVNLLVGKNNSGKTSVLECIQLLSSRMAIRDLVRIARRRGEVLLESDEFRNRPPEIDVRHFFHGHDVTLGTSFKIEDPTFNSLTCEIRESPEETNGQRKLFEENDAGEPITDEESSGTSASAQLALFIETTMDQDVTVIPLSERLGARERILLAKRPAAFFAREYPAVNVVATESLDDSTLSAMWDEIALTPAEQQVVEALRILEPNIERIAFLSGATRYRNGGIVVKLRNIPDRIPLGSFGDGIRRMLALSFAAVRSAGGLLLVDEIDTGLHYSVMADMWRVLVRTAESLNVQVFATTHSQDCLEGLAALHESDPALASVLRLQRIERDAAVTTSYSAKEIAHAAQRHIEVR